LIVFFYSTLFLAFDLLDKGVQPPVGCHCFAHESGRWAAHWLCVIQLCSYGGL